MKKRLLILATTVLLLAQIACGAIAPTGTPDVAATLNALSTLAAQTVAAVATQSAFTPTASAIVVTATPSAVPSALPTFTILTSTPASVPVSYCDAAAFVKDVTFPDGAEISRGASFTKIWRIKNVGTCTWTSAYSLIFASGDSMGGPATVALPATVAPGQSVDIAVTLKAPGQDGHYRGYWKLRNASGVLFGIGPNADTAFWVDIVVSGPSYVAYNFVKQYCKATWSNNNATLPCPGTEGDPAGFVVVLNQPRLENGKKADDDALAMGPKRSANGRVEGEFPAIKIKKGDHFLATINCQYRANKCDVILQLDYILNGHRRTLASWHEVYEGLSYNIDLDLSALEGENVKFILVVKANGDPKDDEALWIGPHILRMGTPPPTRTPTPAPTATPTP
jgi:hypothetical protein